MERTLILATVVVPLVTALLHGWIFRMRRRGGTVHLSLAIVAIAMAVIAAAVIAQGFAATPEQAGFWQRVQIAAGAPLLVSLVRWVHDLLALRRPRTEAATGALALAMLIAVGGDLVFEPEAARRPSLLFHPASWGAPLSGTGQTLVAVIFLLALYVAIELGRAARRDADARSVFVAYLGFGATIVHDGLRAGDWIEGPALLSFGYMILVIGISATLIRRFVRSMQQAECLASQWQERVEERSAELRRKELQLVHGERLATLGTLAGGVAHEINDPMAFVSSNLNRVEELWAHPQERTDVPEILAECREGLARLRSTVAELLRLARGSGTQSVPIDMTEVVTSVLPLVRGEARFRVRLVCNLEPVPPVFGNSGLLAQVVLQLLLNAIRAAPENGADRHRVEVSTRCEDGQIRLRVRDEGPALSPELLPRLFDPFAALPFDVATRTDAFDGARLGLAVTHQIVARHGGRLAVESGANGTLFTVSLPALHEAHSAESDAISA